MRVFILPIILSFVIFQTALAESTLIVNIQGLKSDNGQVSVHLFEATNANAFPTKQDMALRSALNYIRQGTSRIRFSALASGTYAISVYHDENGNNQLDTNWLGIPDEGLGVSKDAKGSFGPPSFKDAAFEVSEDSTVTINMHY
ncbi:MAG: DUF2141 domain-containing protein [Gammaproteobacteria bacterium]|nr:DUF2141 domain-containing protein [Gammaproteobacteria bacterium]